MNKLVYIVICVLLGAMAFLFTFTFLVKLDIRRESTTEEKTNIDNEN